MAEEEFYRTDCQSVLLEIKQQEKQIIRKRRWLLGLTASKSKQKEFEGPESSKYRSLPESLLREDDIFYETIKTHVEEAFGASTAEGGHIATQDEMNLIETCNITKAILSCLDDLTNKGLFLLAMVLTGGSINFEKTRSKMKKVIRDYLPKVFTSGNHNHHHKSEIYRQLSQLLFDPQNFQGQSVTFLTPRSDSHQVAVIKVLQGLENLPSETLNAMYRKLKGAESGKPRLSTCKHGRTRDYLIKQVRKTSKKMLSELAEGDDLQEPLAKAMAIPGLLLKLTPGFQNSSVAEFYPFTSEIKSLQNEIAKAIWLLRTKVRFPELKSLQLLLDPDAKVSNRCLRAGIRKMFTEYLFECSEMDIIPKSLLEALAIINSNSRSSPLGCFRKEEVEEEVECILSVSACTKQIVFDLLPDHDFDQQFADAYMEELEESHSDDNGWLQEDRSSQSSRSLSIDYQVESTAESVPFDFKPPIPTSMENSSSCPFTPQNTLNTNSVADFELKPSTEMDSFAPLGNIFSSPFGGSRSFSSMANMDMNRIKVESIDGSSMPKTNLNDFPSTISAKGRFEEPRCQCNSGVGLTNSSAYTSNFSCGKHKAVNDKQGTCTNQYLAIQEVCDETSLVAYNLIGHLLEEFAIREGLDLDCRDSFYLRGDSSIEENSQGIKAEEEQMVEKFDGGSVVVRVAEGLIPSLPKSGIDRLKKLMGS